MDTRLMNLFMAGTESSLCIAFHYLINNGWDVSTAIDDYSSTFTSLKNAAKQSGESMSIYEQKLVKQDMEIYYKIEGFKIISDDYLFCLPDLKTLDAPIQKYINKQMIDYPLQKLMERTGLLNWWIPELSLDKLFVANTVGDGNCLLHSASMAIWGIDDKFSIVRDLLYNFLQKGDVDSLKRRWRYTYMKSNSTVGLIFTEEEWENEWQIVVQSASPRKLSSNSYQPLEAIHIFALANILGRAIIVIASPFMCDVNGIPLQDSQIGGIYLPYLRSAGECSKMPLIISYNQMHFSAVCPRSNEKIDTKILIQDINNVILPLRYSIDPPMNFDWTRFDSIKDIDEKMDLQKYADLPKYGFGSITNSPMFVTLRVNVHPSSNTLLNNYIAELENYYFKHVINEPTKEVQHRTTHVTSPRISTTQEVKKPGVPYYQKGHLGNQPEPITGHIVKKSRRSSSDLGECSYTTLKDVNVIERTLDIERALCNISLKGMGSNEAICGDLTDDRDSDFSDAEIDQGHIDYSAEEPTTSIKFTQSIQYTTKEYVQPKLLDLPLEPNVQKSNTEYVQSSRKHVQLSIVPKSKTFHITPDPEQPVVENLQQSTKEPSSCKKD